MPERILLIMICLHCTLGGAEKRYARVFEMLVAQPGANHRLLINRTMLNLLQQAGILTNHERYLLILDPPTTRYAWAKRLRGLGPVIDALWYLWQCWLVCWRFRPQIVHPLLTGVYLSLPALLVMPHIRRVMSAYSYQFESYRDRRIGGISIGAAVKRFAMARSQVVEALSEPIRLDLLQRGLPTAKIFVAPCSFTDLTLCKPIWPKERWVVFLGRFVEIKRPLLLLEAIPKVLAHHPDVHFYFLGEGNLQPQMEARLQALGISAAVTMRFEPQPTQVLNRSSIFVSLQTEENYPSQSLLEAMACGNAIVATDVGETWRLVDPSNGICVQPDETSVTAALLILLADPALQERQTRSRQRVLTDYTPERFLAYMQAVYRQALTA